jgi:hypothetical protein
MEKPIVDPIALVGYLLADFDGSERMAAETRRAMLRAARGLSADHSVRQTVDSIAGDLTVAVFAIGNGGNVEAFQAHLVERWQGVALQIKSTKLN